MSDEVSALEAYRRRRIATEQEKLNRRWAHQTYRRILAMPPEDCLREAYRITRGTWRSPCVVNVLLPLLWNLIAQLQPNPPKPRIRGEKLTSTEKNRRWREKQRLLRAHAKAAREAAHA